MACFSPFGEIHHHYTLERTDKPLFPSEIILQSGIPFPPYELSFKECTMLFLIPAISNSCCLCTDSYSVFFLCPPFYLGIFNTADVTWQLHPLFLSSLIANSWFSLLERRHHCRPPHARLKSAVNFSPSSQFLVLVLKLPEQCNNMRRDAYLQMTFAISATGSLNSIFSFRSSLLQIGLFQTNG